MKKAKLEFGKHFKLIGIAVLSLLAIVVIVGWSRSGNNKIVDQGGAHSVTQQQQQQQKQLTPNGIHPNLGEKKKGCNVCQAKKMQAQQQQKQQLTQNSWA